MDWKEVSGKLWRLAESSAFDSGVGLWLVTESGTDWFLAV